jgi:hypothetical protein
MLPGLLHVGQVLSAPCQPNASSFVTCQPNASSSVTCQPSASSSVNVS